MTISGNLMVNKTRPFTESELTMEADDTNGFSG